MAAVDAFIKIGELKGESQDSKHKDWIDVQSWSWGMANHGSGHIGSGSGTGKGTVQDFHFTKVVDTSSADIAKQLLSGKHFPKATFELRKAGGSQPVTYYKVEFDQVYISSMSFGGAGTGGSFTESVTFNFRKYKATYTVQTESGSAGPASSYGWDVAKNEEC